MEPTNRMLTYTNRNGGCVLVGLIPVRPLTGERGVGNDGEKVEGVWEDRQEDSRTGGSA